MGAINLIKKILAVLFKILAALFKLITIVFIAICVITFGYTFTVSGNYLGLFFLFLIILNILWLLIALDKIRASTSIRAAILIVGFLVFPSAFLMMEMNNDYRKGILLLIISMVAIYSGYIRWKYIHQHDEQIQNSLEKEKSKES